MNRVEELACLYISLLRSVYLVHQNSHWLSKGSNFYGNHLLFERIYKSAAEDADTAAEKFIGLFGNEALDLHMQAQLIGETLKDFSSGDPRQMSLGIEKKFLDYSEKLYDVLKEEGMSLGLDDMLMSIASNREGAVYLLQQAEPKGQSRASARAAMLKKAQGWGEQLPLKQQPPTAKNQYDYDAPDRIPSEQPTPSIPKSDGWAGARIDPVFQIMLGVKPDGKLGPLTQAALDAYKRKLVNKYPDRIRNKDISNENAFQYLKGEPEFLTKKEMQKTEIVREVPDFSMPEQPPQISPSEEMSKSQTRMASLKHIIANEELSHMNDFISENIENASYWDLHDLRSNIVKQINNILADSPGEEVPHIMQKKLDIINKEIQKNRNMAAR
jgi:DNA-binding ferritin-like protein